MSNSDEEEYEYEEVEVEVDENGNEIINEEDSQPMEEGEYDYEEVDDEDDLLQKHSKKALSNPSSAGASAASKAGSSSVKKSSGSDYDYAMDANSSEKPSKKQDFIVFTAEELQKKQEVEVWAVHEVLNIPVSVAGALLRFYGWDKEK